MRAQSSKINHYGKHERICKTKNTSTIAVENNSTYKKQNIIDEFLHIFRKLK